MNVAVVMGGYSEESVISLRSGQLILNNLDKNKYQTFEIHILKEEWYCLLAGVKYPINKADFTFTKDNQPCYKIEATDCDNCIEATDLELE
jgi:D-alanine-D-alanine ligase